MAPPTKELDGLVFHVEREEPDIGWLSQAHYSVLAVSVKKEIRTDLIHSVREIRMNTSTQENYDCF